MISLCYQVAALVLEFLRCSLLSRGSNKLTVPSPVRGLSYHTGMPFYLPSGQAVFQPAFFAAPPQPQPAHQNKDSSSVTGQALALPQGWFLGRSPNRNLRRFRRSKTRQFFITWLRRTEDGRERTGSYGFIQAFCAWLPHSMTHEEWLHWCGIVVVIDRRCLSWNALSDAKR